jgi:hypothetical protein
MPFPWELNLDRPYRHDNWLFPEQRARANSTDSVFSGSAETHHEFPADGENLQDTAEDPRWDSPGKRKRSG